MKFAVRFDALRSALLSAAGIATLACGGRAHDDVSASSGGSDHRAAGGDHFETGGTPSNGGKGGTSAGGSGGLGKSTGGTTQVDPTGGVSSGGRATGGTGTGGSAGARSNAYPCENPQPLVSGNDGFVQCADRRIHRVNVTECPSNLPRNAMVANYDPEIDRCQSDADCVEKAHGYCSAIADAVLPSRPTATCVYGCVEDADCNDEAICLCGTDIGRCVSAKCTSDDDCEAGFTCSSYEVVNTSTVCGQNGTAFACQTPDDRCGGPIQCPPLVNKSSGCAIATGESARACVTPVDCATPGRPFLVAGEARRADACGRDDWLVTEFALDAVADSELTPALRETLASHWTRAGQLEHASIAAFARFTLQLLALGAPRELVELSNRALSDELRHARQCFALASRFARRSLGPGPLSIDGSLAELSLAEVAITTIHEGCVGETVAALEAAEAAAHTRDPVVRGVLRQISEDEARHAELAFRFVAWALERLDRDSSDFHRVATALDECAAGDTAAEGPERASPDAEALPAHGVLPPRTLLELRRRALSDVVAPCARSLVAHAVRSPASAPPARLARPA